MEPPHFPLEAPEAFERFDPASLETPPSFADSPEMRTQLATYYAMVENLDWNIGHLRETLDSLPDFESNRLTVYFSDHGDYMGTHGAINRKENPHENSVRIPCSISLAGADSGTRQEGMDFSSALSTCYPTTLGLLGLDVPVHCQGIDFSDGLRGQQDFAGPRFRSY